MNMVAPQPLLSVVSIPLADIDVGERLRGIDDDAAAVIAASMQEQGQRTPIEVRKVGKRYRLIAGAHRMRALALAGIETAFAVVVKATELEAQLLEIDENICRRELSPLDRATFLARRKEVYEELHPETKHGGDRKSDQVDSLVHLIPSFTEATAQKLGLDARTIRRSVARYTSIMTDVREKIANTWIAASGAQLDALARETPDMQRQIAQFIVQWPAMKNVSEIIRQIKGKPQKSPPTMLEKLMALWGKADSATRMRFQEYIAPGLPLDDGREAA
ncbi:MAG: ParB N-terminal domain-containing protein [Acetobacter fabarum]|jgi:ParB family chromosome partitioning protein|nr:ParB N-terminal domain-containing protein [Acetobacter fabarum]MCH4141813.1 ParB N-terminal domain-containing protein [Acetobacter fabarum]MCI1297624.1 ParB N-terminal domain-containing protein [Acetobacter fabarum]MCI1322985.1 ParB N-terminal domain-containing protein [Acetobacter fabarum]MCI1393512.1 ParB N-terminal domain-containing protein [Acetobacter fabarum]